jgi:hypothetical protein
MVFCVFFVCIWFCVCVCVCSVWSSFIFSTHRCCWSIPSTCFRSAFLSSRSTLRPVISLLVCVASCVGAPVPRLLGTLSLLSPFSRWWCTPLCKSISPSFFMLLCIPLSPCVCVCVCVCVCFACMCFCFCFCFCVCVCVCVLVCRCVIFVCSFVRYCVVSFPCVRRSACGRLRVVPTVDTRTW